VKPAVGGVEVSVRYITRASERFQLRARLFQSAVRLLGKSGPEPQPASRYPSASNPNQKGAT